MRFSLLACSLAMNFLIDFGSDGTAMAQRAETVKQWTFNTDGDNEGWTGTNCLRDVVVQDGVLRGIVTGRDPFIVVSGLDIPARPWNVFQARLRIVQDEPLLERGGELFYANSNARTVWRILPGQNGQMDRSRCQYMGSHQHLSVLEQGGEDHQIAA